MKASLYQLNNSEKDNCAKFASALNEAVKYGIDSNIYDGPEDFVSENMFSYLSFIPEILPWEWDHIHTEYAPIVKEFEEKFGVKLDTSWIENC